MAELRDKRTVPYHPLFPRYVCPCAESFAGATFSGFSASAFFLRHPVPALRITLRKIKIPIPTGQRQLHFPVGGCGRLFGLLRRRIQAPPVFQRTLRTQRYLDSFSVIPVQVLIQCVHELVDAHSKPFPVVIHLVLEPSEESFASGIIRRTTFPGHRT